MVKSRASNLQFRNRNSIEEDEDREYFSFQTKSMTQQQWSYQTTDINNPGRRFMSCKAVNKCDFFFRVDPPVGGGNYILHKKIKKLEMEKTSYQMKMKAYCCNSILGYVDCVWDKEVFS
ncbi:hypothetical protein M9H77_36798 [Catharanthus roseus]|uniref:Uncharacterized protein n=1 Tax=Catharanthus roseus TaxID=4058 RepID=A0ACB9ZT72_CATRO|nr:hypothetical protein M9H77_36798 [Catharanthus roseus]